MVDNNDESYLKMGIKTHSQMTSEKLFVEPNLTKQNWGLIDINLIF